MQYDFLELKEHDLKPQRRDAITNESLGSFQKFYSCDDIRKEDIFFYIYGIMHSDDYRNRYSDNLGKELPRVPLVKKFDDFWSFSKSGRLLSDLHVNYESVPPYKLAIVDGESLLDDLDFRVQKMRYGKIGKEKDLTTIVYNDRITVKGIPLEAYEYVVGGKPAIDWVLERQSVKTDKNSGIVNDANSWATETVCNPRYPFELVLRVITVSMETMKIVKSLPALDV